MAKSGTKHGPQVDEYNAFAEQLGRYRAALGRLEALGIRISRSSRLRVYETHLQRVLDDPRPAVEANFVIQLAFDLREIDELVEIVEFLPTAPSPAVIDLLRKIPEGTNHPDDEIAAPAREAQYELYLGAVFRRAGFEAEHGRPDLVVRSEEREFLIEAKRPSSGERLDDRLRSAVRQLRAGQRPGTVALSLDQVIRPRRALLLAPRFADLAPRVVSHRLQEFVDESVSVWRNRLQDNHVGSLFLTARLPARIESSGHLALGTNVRVEVLATTEREAISEFMARASEAYLQAQK